MLRSIAHTLGRLTALMAGLLLGYLGAVSVAPSALVPVYEALSWSACVLLLYVCAGACVGAVGRSTGWRSGLYLAAPGLALLASCYVSGSAPLMVATATVTVLAGALAGAWLGAQAAHLAAASYADRSRERAVM
jgi:hypothetical protein